MLTRKQNELLMFINKRLNDDGVSPSFDEMKEALRLKSKSGIHRLITGLEERGFLRRLPHRARALQVLKLPDTAAMPAPNVMPMLARAGMEIWTARSGSEALRLVLKHDFAVILLDVLMPIMDGFETARLIGRSPCGHCKSNHAGINVLHAFIL